MNRLLTTPPILGLLLITSGCSWLMPDTEKPAIMPVTTQVSPPPQAPAKPALPAVDECQLKCESKGGLKRKYCEKKCQHDLKKTQQKPKTN